MDMKLDMLKLDSYPLIGADESSSWRPSPLPILVRTGSTRWRIDVLNECVSPPPIYPTHSIKAKKMLFAAILTICASSSKKISIYNEEMIVALYFIGFIIFSRKSLGNTFKVTLDGRILSIQEELHQFPNPNEIVPPESNEQQRLLRIILRICGTVVESLPMAVAKCLKDSASFVMPKPKC
ncbi:hypothetical protein H5410_047231 [Solanum commersonii]|uniref:ATP synthase protein MI25 n=1 Tax=Solanum commersonii TaxID=4109 RepID=A0A9J5XGI0_SOLCO|nr:hypothetical protein H5410_047231 [Solanum commersonii]